MELRYRTAIVLVLVLWAMAARVVQGQIFVGSVSGFPQNFSGSIGEYNLDGSPINPALIGGAWNDIEIAGSTMYVLNSGGGFAGTISRFTTGGVPMPMGSAPPYYMLGSLAVSATNLYVAYPSDTGRVGRCTLDGESVDDSFITGMGSAAGAMALSPDQSTLFVTDHYSNTIGEYDAATGVAINAALIAGLDLPTGIAISGSHLYVANAGAGTIGEYNLDGTVVNSALVTGLSGGYQLGHIAVLGNSLYVTDIGRGVVGEYDATTGATINAALISGLQGPTAIAVVPEPASGVLALGCAVGLLGLVTRARQRRWCDSHSSVAQHESAAFSQI